MIDKKAIEAAYIFEDKFFLESLSSLSPLSLKQMQHGVTELSKQLAESKVQMESIISTINERHAEYSDYYESRLQDTEFLIEDLNSPDEVPAENYRLLETLYQDILAEEMEIIDEKMAQTQDRISSLEAEQKTQEEALVNMKNALQNVDPQYEGNKYNDMREDIGLLEGRLKVIPEEIADCNSDLNALNSDRQELQSILQSDPSAINFDAVEWHLTNYKVNAMEKIAQIETEASRQIESLNANNNYIESHINALNNTAQHIDTAISSNEQKINRVESLKNTINGIYTDENKSSRGTVLSVDSIVKHNQQNESSLLNAINLTTSNYQGSMDAETKSALEQDKNLCMESKAALKEHANNLSEYFSDMRESMKSESYELMENKALEFKEAFDATLNDSSAESSSSQFSEKLASFLDKQNKSIMDDSKKLSHSSAYGREMKKITISAYEEAINDSQGYLLAYQDELKEIENSRQETISAGSSEKASGKTNPLVAQLMRQSAEAKSNAENKKEQIEEISAPSTPTMASAGKG
jgi:prefoldin subunit 5